MSLPVCVRCTGGSVSVWRVDSWAFTWSCRTRSWCVVAGVRLSHVVPHAVPERPAVPQRSVCPRLFLLSRHQNYLSDFTGRAGGERSWAVHLYGWWSSSNDTQQVIRPVVSLNISSNRKVKRRINVKTMTDCEAHHKHSWMWQFVVMTWHPWSLYVLCLCSFLEQVTHEDDTRVCANARHVNITTLITDAYEVCVCAGHTGSSDVKDLTNVSSHSPLCLSTEVWISYGEACGYVEMQTPYSGSSGSWRHHQRQHCETRIFLSLFVCEQALNVFSCASDVSAAAIGQSRCFAVTGAPVWPLRPL